jgi:hypothetical protein
MKRDRDITADLPSVSMLSFETKERLVEHLRMHADSELLTSDHAREFFSIEISFPGQQSRSIGLLSWGMGIRPSWTTKGSNVLIGCNKEIVVCRPTDVRLERVRLDDLFWEFLEVDVPHVCILCEASVHAVEPSGAFVWRTNTDLVKSFRVTGKVVVIEPFDDEARAVTIDLLSGAIATSR